MIKKVYRGITTALHEAAEQGNLDVIQFLIDKGAEVNHCDDWNYTPLANAVIKGNSDAVRLLLENGAAKTIDVHLEGDGDKDTSLIKAAGLGDCEIVNLLLAYGAQIGVINLQGTTPLIRAAAYGNTVIVDTLLQHGQNINQKKTLNGNTALILATYHCKIETVQYLLEHGADATQINKCEKTALDYAFEIKNKELIELLTIPQICKKAFQYYSLPCELADYMTQFVVHNTKHKN